MPAAIGLLMLVQPIALALWKVNHALRVPDKSCLFRCTLHITTGPLCHEAESTLASCDEIGVWSVAEFLDIDLIP